MSSRRGRKRRGTILILFVMLLFAFLAMCALVIDVGHARVAQRQMQSAADTAALESLRFRDDIPFAWRNAETAPVELVAAIGEPPTTPYDSDDAGWSDWQTYINKARRWAASHMVSLLFDDDLQPENGDAIGFGAGGTVQLTDTPGIGVPAASQQLDVAASPFYKPQLRANLSNYPSGDLVQGAYDDHRSTFPDDVPSYSDELKNANGVYARRDFQPTVSENSESMADASLVRLRRTNENFSAGDASSSNGPPVPLLFGRGTTLRSEQKQAGVAVRATAIASYGDKSFNGETYDAGRAMTAGPADVTSGTKVPGVTPFGLTQPFWSNLNSQACKLDVAGNLLDSTGAVIGIIAAPSLFGLGQPLTVASNIALISDIASDDRQFYLYVPIYAPIGSQPQTIVGFGQLTWNYETTAELPLTLTKRSNRIASVNAAASLALSLPSIFADQPNDPDFSQLWEQHRLLDDPLYAPVLVNRHIGPAN